MLRIGFAPIAAAHHHEDAAVRELGERRFDQAARAAFGVAHHPLGGAPREVLAVGPSSDQHQNICVSPAAAGVPQLAVRPERRGLCRDEDLARTRDKGNAAEVTEVDGVLADPDPFKGVLGGEITRLHDSLIEQPAVAVVRRHPITQIIGFLRDRGFDGIRVQSRRVQRVEDRDQPSCDGVQRRGDRLTPIAVGQARDEIWPHGLVLPRVPLVYGNLIAGTQRGVGLLQVNGVVKARRIGRKAPADQTERR